MKKTLLLVLVVLVVLVLALTLGACGSDTPAVQSQSAEPEWKWATSLSTSTLADEYKTLNGSHIISVTSIQEDGMEVRVTTYRESHGLYAYEDIFLSWGKEYQDEEIKIVPTIIGKPGSGVGMLQIFTAK